MKKVIALLSTVAMALGATLHAADTPFLNYQNYNHGYCPECNCAPCGCAQPPAPVPAPPPGAVPPPPPAACAPCQQQPCSPCDPCAPVCGAECGVSICAIGVGIAALAAAAAIIVASGSGSSSTHQHS